MNKQNKYLVNAVANQLHHHEKTMILKKITRFNQDIASFQFQPVDKSDLAFFNPGQYVRIYVRNEQICASRDYALSSTPLQAINEKQYTITIKRVPNGKVSNYMLDKATEGEIFGVSSPVGGFYYSKIRDHYQVVGIAGGSGITPFYSIAQALNDGTLDFKLILFYGVNTLSEAVFAKELLAMQSDKFKLVLVLGKETHPDYESGFVSRKLVDKYIKDNYSLFVCGSNGLYNFIFKEFKDIPLKDRKMEPNPIAIRTVKEPKVFKIKLHLQNELFNINANNEETILVAIEKAGIKAPSRCKSGSCGFCRAQLVSGNVYLCADKRRKADQSINAIHTCCAYPESDLELIINQNI